MTAREEEERGEKQPIFKQAQDPGLQRMYTGQDAKESTKALAAHLHFLSFLT